MSTANETKSLLLPAQTRAIPWSMIYAVSAAILVGTFIIAAVGFAAPEILHNAAHDIRHGLAFPCH